jgi:hypothetical protein
VPVRGEPWNVRHAFVTAAAARHDCCGHVWGLTPDVSEGDMPLAARVGDVVRELSGLLTVGSADGPAGYARAS